jgi:hypothetical protein
LEFTVPNLLAFDIKLASIQDLLTENPPDEVVSWISTKIAESTSASQQAEQATHVANARRLAVATVHKYCKWLVPRFGSTPETQVCFYDGSPRINSDANPITYAPAFSEAVVSIASDAGVPGQEILTSLNIGMASAKRFMEFIHVPIIPSPPLFNHPVSLPSEAESDSEVDDDDDN